MSSLTIRLVCLLLCRRFKIGSMTVVEAPLSTTACTGRQVLVNRTAAMACDSKNLFALVFIFFTLVGLFEKK